MTMQTAALSPNPIAPPPANAQSRSPVDTRDDAFGAALKAADQNRINTRQAAAAKDKSAAENDSGTPVDRSSANPLDPQWLANFAAMIGHLQPLQQQPAQPVVDASVAMQEGADAETAALTGITADPADMPEDTLNADDDAVLAQLADSVSSSRSKRSAGIAATSDAMGSASARPVATDISARSAGNQESADAGNAQATPATATVALAARSAEPGADAATTMATAETSTVSDVTAPSTSHGHTHGTQATLARAEAPTIPGAATSLHGQALQGRLDEALRWMAGNGVQTAQIQITPDELGPITIQVQLQGDTANVLFSSAHEQTRQVLESSLGGLRDALAAGGLSLGQASVGSEQQQRNMFADTGSGERRQTDTDTSIVLVDGAASAQPAPTPQRAAGATGATRQGIGLVNLYA